MQCLFAICKRPLDILVSDSVLDAMTNPHKYHYNNAYQGHGILRNLRMMVIFALVIADNRDYVYFILPLIIHFGSLLN